MTAFKSGAGSATAIVLRPTAVAIVTAKILSIWPHPLCFNLSPGGRAACSCCGGLPAPVRGMKMNYYSPSQELFSDADGRARLALICALDNSLLNFLKHSVDLG